MRILLTISLLTTLLVCGISTSRAVELSGHIGIEGRYFSRPPLFEGQERHDSSLTIQPELYHELKDGSSIIFVPFGRIDTADKERTHFDIRELNYLHLGDLYEVRLGIGKVFWGATEFAHLVDIINQTDLVEDIDNEEKLGQPMVHLSLPEAWGTVDLFILPYFRKRTFPGKDGRLRPELVVDTNLERFESGSEEKHVDLALRYSRTIGDMDLGAYYFKGTGREPTLLPGTDSSGATVLIPFYEQIGQAGLDVQLVAGAWLWKLEALHRTGQGEAFFATVGGFERTFYGVFDTTLDLGVIAEYAYDDRDDDATSGYQNDVMLGLRLAFNDTADSEILTGYIHDLDSSARLFSIEAGRRFGQHVRATVEVRVLSSITKDDPAYGLRGDDHMRFELNYYF